MKRRLEEEREMNKCTHVKTWYKGGWMGACGRGYYIIMTAFVDMFYVWTPLFFGSCL